MNNIIRLGIIGGCFIAAPIGYSSPAWPETSDAILAQSLFDEGRAAMEAGHYDEACKKFEESQKLDPGLGTLLNLGECYAKSGKTASAWVTFKDGQSLARKNHDNAREQFATERIQQLESTLSHVVIRVDSNQYQVEVRLDGKKLPKAIWGTRIPADPGEHTVTASAPGKSTWYSKFRLGAKSDLVTVKIPVLPVGSGTVRATNQPSAGTPSSSSSSAKSLGYTIGVAGVVAGLVGGYYGLTALSTWDDRNSHCPNDKCDSTGKELEDRANMQATVSNIGLGLGLVGIGLGTYLVLTAPSDTPNDTTATLVLAPTVGSSGGGLTVHGTW